MKKYIVFAAAALVALAACSKVETVDTPDQPVTFQVANYSHQTKADSKFDENADFHTYAFFHPVTGDAQWFINNDRVYYHNNAWSPDRTYFWPKTGSVNFFSYTGSPLPSAMTLATEGTFKYGDASAETPTYVTIATDSDPMVANGAYTYSNSSANEYSHTYSSTNPTGVPTLFHHLVSKVSFIVKFSAEGITDTKNKWVLQINSASLNYANQGNLTISFIAPSTTGQAEWPFAAQAVNWGRNETNTTLSATDNLGETNTQEVVAPNVSDGKTLFNEISVLPQDIRATGSNAKFAINYTLTHYYDTQDYTANPDGPAVWTQQIYETVDLTGDNAIALATKFSNAAISAWNMNYKYVYTVTIKPNGTVTFDPAVEEWSGTVNSGYTYPEN